MTRVVFFIEQIANGLYLICAVGLLFSVRSFFISRRELWAAEFELEREQAQRKQASAITWTLGLVEIVLAIYAVATVVAPTLRNDVVAPGGSSGGVPDQPFITSTPGGDGLAVNDQGTPLGDNSVEAMMLTVTAAVQNANGSGPKILATPTISPTPVGTIIAGDPPPLGCDKTNAQLEVPANGQVLFDSVTVIGTAQTENFAFYKFELNGPSTGGAYAPVGGDKTSPVPSKGVLGQLALSPFQPGTYLFRLTVFDNKNALRAQCVVTVHVRERPPTPTPPGGGAQ